METLVTHVKAGGKGQDEVQHPKGFDEYGASKVGGPYLEWSTGRIMRLSDLCSRSPKPTSNSSVLAL